MKAYIFEDSLFAWGCVVLANSEEDARVILRKQGESKFATLPVTVKPLTEGFLMQAGGNR